MAESKEESSFAHNNDSGSEDSDSLLQGEGTVVLIQNSRKRPHFSQSTTNCCKNLGQWNEDDQPLLDNLSKCPPSNGKIKEEVAAVEIDSLPDACFGLLGTVCWDVPQGHINQLPNEVLKEIFALVPAMDLYQSLSLVCQRWQQIISDPHVSYSLFFSWLLMFCA